MAKNKEATLSEKELEILRQISVFARSHEDYLELRKGLPPEFQELLDRTRKLELALERIAQLVLRIAEEGRQPTSIPISILAIPNALFSEVAEIYLAILEKYRPFIEKYVPPVKVDNTEKSIVDAIKEEIINLLTYAPEVIRTITEVGRAAIAVIVAYKIFIDHFVYGPLEHIKKNYSAIIAKEIATQIKDKPGYLRHPAEILRREVKK